MECVFLVLKGTMNRIRIDLPLYPKQPYVGCSQQREGVHIYDGRLRNVHHDVLDGARNIALHYPGDGSHLVSRTLAEPAEGTNDALHTATGFLSNL